MVNYPLRDRKVWVLICPGPSQTKDFRNGTATLCDAPHIKCLSTITRVHTS